MNKKIIGIIAAASALTIAAAGIAVASAGKNETAVNIINDLPPANPGPGETIGSYPENSEAGEGEETRLIDENPIKKWGYVTSVDKENGRIVFNSNEMYTDENGNTTDTVQEIVLNMADGVPVIDAVSGLPVAFEDINTSAPAYVWTSQIMTMSLPPRTPAQALIVNVPADYAAPSYVVVKEIAAADTDGSTQLTITDQDGNKWNISGENTQVTPYLTRNIVTADDIEVGSKCIIWRTTDAVSEVLPAEYNAAKVMLFAW